MKGMAPRRRCPVCGSKQWHKEPSSGLITCSEGHVLQNYRNETTEVTELGPHAVRKRTLKSGRKRKLKLSKADPMLYHGERARYHYFECLQLVLRMQVSSLIQLWGLPSEFETVCRDIWALHLALLPSPPPAEPLNHAKDEAGDQAQDILSPPPDDTPPGENDDTAFKDEDDIEDAMSEYSSSSSGEEDAEMADLMRENSEISSSSGEEESDQAQPRVKGTRRKRLYRKYDAPASNIAVLILACWTLRLPVMYMDFVRLIEAYELPYLDPVRLLPVSLTRHLTKHTTHALSPHHAPTPIHLHRLCARLAKLLNSSYGVHTPELNAAPVLWRAVRSLCGTPTLYMLAKKLARVISIPLSLHRSLVPALTRAKTRDSSWHKHDDAIPEVAIAAAVIIVLKMTYGLDGKPRQPSQKDDPACALPRLSEYLLALRECEQAATSKEELFSATSQWSVLDMTEPMIDQYLQFCERALLPREDQMIDRNVTTDHFPLNRGVAQPADMEWAGDQSKHTDMPANSVDANEEALHPGQCYVIYNTLDLLGSLPEEYELVISRAARWAGVDDDYVCGVVERFERRLVRWWDGVRRKERRENNTETETLGEEGQGSFIEPL